MTALEDRLDAVRRVQRCSFALLLAEDDLATPRGSIDALGKAQDDLELACRDLVNIVCELHPDDRPGGWEPDPGARTA